MSAPKSNQRLALIGALLALITTALFWTLLSCDFITFDDDRYVTANTHVQAGLTWAGVKWAFQSMVSSNWHPLTWMSHMLDCQWWGLDPAGHHLTSLVLHVANVVLLLVWLQKMTGAIWRSALVAALFAWHPLHVESVAWVAERKDVLSTFFWLLALLAYTRYAAPSKIKNPDSKIYYGLALLCFTLGLLSKPMVVTFPFVLLLLDYWPLNRIAGSGETVNPPTPWKKLVVEKIPFFLVAAVSSVVTIFVQKSGGTVSTFDLLPVEERLGNALVAYCVYLRKALWPVDLAVFYPHPGARPMTQVAAASMILLAITLLVLKFMRRRSYLAVGWFWFLGTLIPVIGLVQVGGQSLADRYTYVPLIGIFIIAAWGVTDLVVNRPQLKVPLITAVVSLLGGCIVVTAIQETYWRNSELLFKHDLKVVGDNYVGYSDLAVFLLLHDRIDEALDYFERANRIRPSADAEFNIGETYLHLGQLALAAEHLDLALQLNPNHPQAHYDQGELLALQKRNPEAVVEFRKALRLRPNWPSAQTALSKVLLEQGDLKAAADQTAAAAQSDTQNPEMEVQLGMLMAQQQRVPDAIQHYHEAVRRYQEVLRHAPDNPETLNNLAWLLATNPNAEIRNGAEAVTLARRAGELTHWQRAQIIGTLAGAYAEAGQFDDAVKTAQTARDIAWKTGETDLATRNEVLIKLYQNHQAYREAY